MSSLEGADDLQARFRALQSGKAGRIILGQLGLLAVQYAKELAPRKTGNLARTIRLGDVDVSGQRVQVLAGGAAARLGSSGAVGYAAHVEFGTKPHDIRPRNKKVLAWPAKPAGRRLTGSARVATRRGGLGGMRFARIVHHPGTKAQPYLVPGAEKALREVGMAKAIISVWNSAA